MTLCVFVGPTLKRRDVAASCDAVCLPPAAQGDVYRAAAKRPRAIGVIDGYFSGMPSVWHKEILWAIAEGIPVFGSASMGALRAAELHTFGMRGVGRIFEAFRDGLLEDDDEVAVTHGPAETGFIALSDAMVNIRATLAAAEAEGILTAAARVALEAHAKSLFFPRRSWAALLEAGRALGVSDGELARLAAWLPQGKVDQKREDALEMLAAMGEARAEPGAQPQGFEFAWTHFFEEMTARQSNDTAVGSAESALPHRQILDELRLEGPEPYAQARTRALLRLFAGREGKRRGGEAPREAARAALSRMRAALGLFTRAQLDQWLLRNHLDMPALERLVTDEARSEAAAAAAGPELDRLLLDELRLAGGYERLAERARQKEESLARNGFAEGAGPNPAQLALWFVERRLGLPAPDDIAAFARELGFSDLEEFHSALRREWIYCERAK